MHEEYAPPTTTDFTAPAQRIFDALAKEQGEKIIWRAVGRRRPDGQARARSIRKRLGIDLATGGNILPVLASLQRVPSLEGMEGATYYYYDIPKNPANDWLVAEHKKRFNEPPDFFTADGMATGMALVAALDEDQRRYATRRMLIPAMEGMAFDTPKGKMLFRREDHQTLQSMYGFKLKVDPAAPWAVPVLTREFKIEDMQIPIANRR